MDVEKLEIAVENGKKAFEAKQYVILVFIVSERANELYLLFLVYSVHKVTFGFSTGLNQFGMFQLGTYVTADSTVVLGFSGRGTTSKTIHSARIN